VRVFWGSSALTLSLSLSLSLSSSLSLGDPSQALPSSSSVNAVFQHIQGLYCASVSLREREREGERERERGREGGREGEREGDWSR